MSEDIDAVLTDDEEPAVLLDASREGVAYLTLNRPRKKNAFGPALILALIDAFETLAGADHVRIVFLRGGGGVFSAGADLDWMAESADWLEDDNFEDALRLARMLKHLNDLPQLTVALVEGAAFGGGAGLVCACDVAIAQKDAVFAFSEARLGLIPATISPYAVGALGERRARMLFATGRRFGAEEAKTFGLVQEVVESPEALDLEADRLARDILACAPEAARLSKALVGEVAGRGIDEALLRHTAHAIARRRASPEAREGVRAFLERRRPSWAVL